MTLNERDIRAMAMAWLDSEIARLRALRAELAAKPAKSEKEKKAAAAILADRATEKKPHWTQLPKNKAKMRRTVKKMQAGKAAKEETGG